MADTYDEWCVRIQPAIDNPLDGATVVSVLTGAREQYRELFSDKVAADELVAKLTEENARLMDTNRELFLRIGQQVREESRPVDAKPRAETITVEDLFKED